MHTVDEGYAENMIPHFLNSCIFIHAQLFDSHLTCRNMFFRAASERAVVAHTRYRVAITFSRAAET